MLATTMACYKNFDNKIWCLENINIGQNLMIEYNLESGERDLLDDDIGIRVWDLEIGFGLKGLGFGIDIDTSFDFRV